MRSCPARSSSGQTASVPESPFFWIDSSTWPNGVALKVPSASGFGTEDVKARCSKELSGCHTEQASDRFGPGIPCKSRNWHALPAAHLIFSSVRDGPAGAFGPSRSSTPCAASSSRIRSASAKSLDFLASVRSAIRCSTAEASKPRAFAPRSRIRRRIASGDSVPIPSSASSARNPAWACSTELRDALPFFFIAWSQSSFTALRKSASLASATGMLRSSSSDSRNASTNPAISAGAGPSLSTTRFGGSASSRCFVL